MGIFVIAVAIVAASFVFKSRSGLWGSFLFLTLVGWGWRTLTYPTSEHATAQAVVIFAAAIIIGAKALYYNLRQVAALLALVGAVGVVVWAFTGDEAAFFYVVTLPALAFEWIWEFFFDPGVWPRAAGAFLLELGQTFLAEL